ncbi:MAG: hypothetical protein WA324_12940 [Bryobacteraceae bacterium]
MESNVFQGRDAQIYAGATALGVVAGMRSMAAPAILGRLSRTRCLKEGCATTTEELAQDGHGIKHASRRTSGFLSCLGARSRALCAFEKPVIAHSLLALAIGEFVFDKLPFMPKRTQTGSLIARMASGAICGALFCSALKRSPVMGAFAGASAALGGTYAFYELRRAATEELGMPGFAVALAEDAVVAGLGFMVANAASGKLRVKQIKEAVKGDVRELAELRRHPLS